MIEYIGYKDHIGGGQFNMGLTDTEIIRCRDCAHSDTEDGMMFCRIASTGQWKYAPVDSDGFCAWAERRDA